MGMESLQVTIPQSKLVLIEEVGLPAVFVVSVADLGTLISKVLNTPIIWK